MQFTIGADPEFFLMKNKKYVSAVGMIGGSKNEPLALDKEGFAILEDNVSVEFNIAPCHNHEEFVGAIGYVMDDLKKRLLGYEFGEDSAVLFNPRELMHPQAMEFGCEPDYNVWTMDINPRPVATDATLRSAGGHVHVGTTLPTPDVIKAMDLFLGVPSTVLDNGTLRRQLYGKAGSHRPKPYGCEYRTLSNFWIFKKELIEWVYNQTNKALEFVANGNKITDEEGTLIQACINNDDRSAYESLKSTFGLA